MTAFSLPRIFIVLALSIVTVGTAAARDVRTPRPLLPRTGVAVAPSPHVGSSPFDPPKANDATFVVDQDSGLDTGCAFRSDGPLRFSIMINRVIGDVDKLRQAGLIGDTVTLRLPAYDVDFAGGGSLPERDRVTFNGEVVPGNFLQGEDGVWRLNAFDIPIDLVRFPADPGPGGSVTPEENTIQIDIDTLNEGGDEAWCVEIDWAAIEVTAPRPVVMAHGILSSGSTWSGQWVPGLDALGIPNSNALNMGNLDSIQNNARKIANEVTASRTRWGVDQVVIVAHSKGGLDSRHFVENSEDVEQVVQLGTPNAGSPLADVVQGGAIGLLGLGGAFIVNALAGPAGVQLTQPYMAAYNAYHGSNAKVRYTALAGDYDPDCFLLNPFCRPLDRLLLAITGRGDTIVPVTSVHALSFTNDRTFGSSGNDGDAKHTSLTGSARVFGAVRDRVTAPGTPVMRAATLPATTIGRTATLAGTLHQTELVELSLPIDQATNGFVSLLYPSGDLRLELVAPSGRVITPESAGTDADVEYQQDAILGGLAAVYSFDAFEVGVWTARISALSVVDPSGEVPFTLSAWITDPNIRFGGSVPEPYHTLGTPISLMAVLENTAGPIPGATVVAQIALPDGTVREVTLSDGTGPAAGDGIYDGTLTDTTQPGIYRVRFTATRAAGGGYAAFSREDFGIATVSRSNSSLTGTFSDTGLDSNGNGLFDELLVRLDINITDPGTFRVLGRLSDGAGNELVANAVATLGSGVSQVVLHFDGSTLFRNAVNGPYSLSLVRLAEDGENDLLPVEEQTGVYATTAYAFTQFEHGALFLTGNGSADGADIDGNGLFDQLNVGIGVQVETASFYQWTARLLDGNGKEIDFQSGDASFPAGESFMTFAFDGHKIGMNGVNGPYVVADLLLFGASDSLVATRAFTTQYFDVQQFEDAPPPTTTTTTPITTPTTTTTTTTTTTIPTTTTTITATTSTSSSTSTTLPGCPVSSSFESVRCRLADLGTIVANLPPPFDQYAQRTLLRALTEIARADTARQAGNRPALIRALRKADKALASLKQRITSLLARQRIDEAERTRCIDVITALKSAIGDLRGT